MKDQCVDHSNTKVTLTTNGTLNEKKMIKLLDTGINLGREHSAENDTYKNKMEEI